MNQLRMKEIKIELSFPTLFSELNKEHLPQELKVFSSGDELLDEAIKRFSHLNASNCTF